MNVIFTCYFLNIDYRSCADFGYEEINGISGYCFKDYGVKKPYSEAQNTCQNDGGHLVQISTSTKLGSIQSFMNLKSSMFKYHSVAYKNNRILDTLFDK